jgi:protein phosphatase
VIEATRESAEYEGMATTVAAVLVDGDIANLAHVGDSRIYLWNGERVEQLTRDHSWVNEQIENGAISPEQARSHPLRNVVTRALGGRADLVVDIQSRRMEPGNMLLLCSDGLTTMVTGRRHRPHPARVGRGRRQGHHGAGHRGQRKGR